MGNRETGSRCSNHLIVLLFTGAFCGVILWQFPFLRQGWFVWRVYVRPLLILAVLWTVSLGVGCRLWKILRLPSHESDSLDFFPSPSRTIITSTEFFLFATLLGLGAVAYALFGLCLLRLLSVKTALVCMALLGIWGAQPLEHLVEFWWSRAHLENLQPRKRHRIGNRFLYSAFIPMILVAIVVPGFLSAIGPPCQSDALRYHLAVPEIYLRHGGWVDLPYSSFSNFPFVVEMLYLFPMVFGAPEVTGLIHFFSLLLLLALVYLMGKRLLGVRPGALATAIFATTPFVPILAGWGFIEVALAAYQLAAVYALVLAEKHWKSDSRNSHLRLSGVLLGLCLGIKYTSIFYAFFLFCWLCYVSFWKYGGQDKSASGRVKPLLVLCFAAFLIGVPWYLKNLILFGNPIYPLLGETLGRGNWSALNTALYKFHMSLKGGLWQLGASDFWSRVVDFFTLPWRITVNPSDFGGWPIGVIYLPAALFVLASRRTTGALRRLMLLGFCLFVFWAYTYRDTRFLLLPLALLSLGIGICADRVLRNRGLRGRVVAWVFALGMLVNFALFVHNLFTRYFPADYLSGSIGREGFLSRKLEYHPAFVELGRLADKDGMVDGRVLFVGEHRGMYCPLDYVASDWFDTPVLIRWLRETPNNEALLQRLQAEKIAFVLHNERELSRYFSPWFMIHFLPEDQAVQYIQTARSQGRNLNTIEERQFLQRQATSSEIFQRYTQFMDNREWLDPVWEKRGVTVFRVRF